MYSSIHPLAGFLTVRALLLAVLYLIVTVKTHAQTDTYTYGKIAVEISKQKWPKKIECKVEIISAFTGGDSVWTNSLENSLNRSISYHNGAPRGNYTVHVQFVVAKDGSISDVRPLTSNGYGMEAEVVRALRKKDPMKWTPAPRGKTVREYRQ